MFNVEDAHNARYVSSLALEPFHKQGQQPNDLENWQYKTFNAVMYVPEGGSLNVQIFFATVFVVDLKKIILKIFCTFSDL